MNFKNTKNYLPSIIFTILVLLVWEISANSDLANPRLLPPPSATLNGLANNWDIILKHAAQTLTEAFWGFIIAIALGAGLAIIIDQNTFLRKIIYPLLVTSQTIPMIVLAPLLLVWFGFGILPKIIMVILFCFFPITIATASGLANADQEKIKLLLSMNADKWQILKFVKIPESLPSFFGGLKIAATYSVTGAIIGEFVGAEKGLGIYMKLMANSHAVPLVFAAILVTIILSLTFFLIIVAIEKKATPWNQE